MSKPSSSQVNKEIRSQIKPLLQAAGFSDFTARTSWRFRPDRIDVVNFQSFNSYLAEGVGCTTYSFALNIGCYLQYIPRPYSVKSGDKDRKSLPKEYECHLRRSLRKHLDQPELPRKNVWYIDPALRYLQPAVHDAAAVIQRDAFPWFDRFSNDEEVLRTFLEDSGTTEGTWGFGANPSPARSYVIAYTALLLRRQDLAVPHLEKAIRSGCFAKVQPELEKELDQARKALAC